MSKFEIVLEVIGAIAVIARVLALFLPEGAAKEKALAVAFAADKIFGKPATKPGSVDEKSMVELLKERK